MTAQPAPPAEALTIQFRPLHKRAFGMAIGIAAAILVFLVTAIHLVRDPEPAIPLDLLAQYFSGYSVSWPGALVGAVWAGFAGFMLGWFFAFCRNLLIAVLVLMTRSRAELAQTRDFLDHI